MENQDVVTCTGDESSIPGVVNTMPLAERLAVTAAGSSEFTGIPVEGFNQRVFGGHLLAQALLAAGQTVEKTRIVNSLHAYFLRTGVPDAEIIYKVTRIRDGRSISVRSVTAHQAGRELMTFQSSFAVERPLTDIVAVAAPDAPHPETLPPLHERLCDPELPPDGINWPARKHWRTASRPMDIRYIDDPASPSVRRYWFRTEALDPGATQNDHRAIIAFASDRSLLPVIAKTRGDLGRAGQQKVASVDHALWFHQDVRSGDWLQYVQDSPHSATRGFGTARGMIFSLDGVLVASVVQQGFRQ